MSPFCSGFASSRPPSPAARDACRRTHQPRSRYRQQSNVLNLSRRRNSRPETAPPPPAVAGDPARSRDDAECALTAEPGEPITTVALGEPVDPAHAPHPTNDSERLLFRQLYETLLRADCHGHAVPGLASEWRLDADGRTWIVVLREHARFSDGTPLTAAAIRASWVEPGDEEALRPRVRRLVESVAAVDDTTLAVTLRTRRGEAPLALAHTDLAIARRGPWNTLAARHTRGSRHAGTRRVRQRSRG